MGIEFDPVKDADNIRERGLPFPLVAEFDFESALIWQDTRKADPQARFSALGMIASGFIPWCSPQSPAVFVSSAFARQTNERYNAMSKRPNPELIDDENPEWTAEMVRDSIRFADLPQTLQAKLRRGRGPNKAPTKERISIRISSETVRYFRAMGDGWQTRMDEALSEWRAARA